RNSPATVTGECHSWYAAAYVPGEFPHQLARINVPQPQRLFRRAARQHVTPIGRNGNSVHSLLVPLERLQLLPCFDVPQIDGADPGPRHGPVPVWGERRVHHPIRVTLKPAEFHPCFGVPHACGSIRTRREYLATVGGKGQGVNAVTPHESLDFLPGVHIQEDNRGTVVSPVEDAMAVRRKGY